MVAGSGGSGLRAGSINQACGSSLARRPLGGLSAEKAPPGGGLDDAGFPDRDVSILLG